MEKLYVIKCGDRYVRFNLDGSMIGCKYKSSITTLDYLNKLPFNAPLAEASGIIKIEEVQYQNVYGKSE
ncbi:hypothetical protein [Paenibacillus xylaniclasticus]|uniref:hypothetical protein n=1 Tax=Paenibacillus xylaniclasticus TaxID=588083 RepID=UPI000FDC4439|nr:MULTISPECIES: hypothetical protein [Paenibacillus]GFN32512.1 hypothetical protein PCURB6_27720 [Paenibacillus curdlanolyticus]